MSGSDEVQRCRAATHRKRPAPVSRGLVLSGRHQTAVHYRALPGTTGRGRAKRRSSRVPFFFVPDRVDVGIVFGGLPRAGLLLAERLHHHRVLFHLLPIEMRLPVRLYIY